MRCNVFRQMMHAIQSGTVEAKEQTHVVPHGVNVVAEATTVRASLTSLTGPAVEKGVEAAPVKEAAAPAARVAAPVVAEESAEPVVLPTVAVKAPVVAKAVAVPVVSVLLPQPAVVEAGGRLEKATTPKKQAADVNAKGENKGAEGAQLAAIEVAPAVVVAVPVADASIVKGVQEKVASAVSVGIPASGHRAAAVDGKKTSGMASGLEAKADAGASVDAGKLSSFEHAVSEVASVREASVPAAHADASTVAVAPMIAPAVVPGGVSAPAREAVSGHRGTSADSGTDQASSGGVGAGDTRTLVATPNVLEVGITGGSHGWLRVRAELGHTGEVTASLVASNAASAETLHKSLGAITDYLKSESVGVSSLAVTTPEKSSGALAAATYDASAGGGTQGQMGAGEGSSEGASGGVEEVGGWEELAGGIEVGVAGSSMSAMVSGGSGGWLSVRV